jgi:hypothetical protein
VAPAATIRLAPLNGGAHEGSFFALRVEAEARTPINFVSFSNWDTLIKKCTANPYKDVPGVCGCGRSDRDDDSDGFPNCIDPCPLDPNKVDPGITGCGNSEVDADGDGIPDFIDEYPNDPEQEYSKICKDAPDGTPCDDGICHGIYTCNGGKCGSASDCMPSCGQCEIRVFWGKTYWFCNEKVSWEAAQSCCREERSRALLRIETSAEHNAIHKHLSLLDQNDVWMGANDRTEEGMWNWSNTAVDNARLFWIGDANGRRHYANAIEWASGEPSAEGGRDCGMISGADGKWHAAPCNAAKGFICEGIRDRIPIDNHHRNGIDPGIDPDSGSDACVPISTDDAIPLSDEEIAKVEACMNMDEATYYSNNCDQMRIGSVPPDDSTCEAWEGDKNATFLAESSFYKILPNRDCALVAARLSNETGLPKLCEAAEGCSVDEVCGKYSVCCDKATGACDWTQRCDTCSDTDPDICENFNSCDAGRVCVASQVCGYISNDNMPPGVDFALEMQQRIAACRGELVDEHPCEQVTYCNTGEEDLKADETAMEEELDNPLPLDGFPVVPVDDGVDTDTAYIIPPEDLDPCNGQAVCNKKEAHPWCHYNTAEPPDDVGVKPERDLGATADDGKSSNKKVEFSFDPKFKMSYEVNPGPLGMYEFNLGAHAGLSAGVELNNVFGKTRTLDFIDTQLYVRLGLNTAEELCGLTTSGWENGRAVPSKIVVFGMDFMPADKANINKPDKEAQRKCVETYSRFKKVVNSAKKALRDAEELIRQYRDAEAAGSNFANGLCLQLAANPPKGFPPVTKGFTCQTERPEDTINRFVTYYNGYVMDQLYTAATELARADGPLAFGDEISLLTLGEEKEITLWNQTFFIGPIPANLEVFIALAYGFNLDANYSITPGTVLVQALNLKTVNPSTEIAWVGIRAKPYAAVRLGLFVGVGFDIGIMAAKAGIEGLLSLGEISVPANAGVGIRFTAESDTRALPAESRDMAALDGGEPIFNVLPKKYALSLGYDMDVGAQIDDMLSGSIGVKVKLKFLFFSKTWRKQIAKWSGFCPPGAPCTTNKKTNPKRPCWCDPNLFSIAGDVAALNFDVPWATTKMKMPFPQLQPIASYRAPASSESPDGTEVVPMATLDTGKVEEFFFDSLCTCITALPKTASFEEFMQHDECFRSDDCCADLVCAQESRGIPGSANASRVKGICLDCSVERPKKILCASASDCCPSDFCGTEKECLTCMGAGYGIAAGGLNCTNDDDCCIDARCNSDGAITGVPLNACYYENIIF